VWSALEVEDLEGVASDEGVLVVVSRYEKMRKGE